MRNTNKSGFRWKRSGILLAAVIVLLAGAVGGTWAFLVAQSEPVQNNFTYAHVRCTINEKFENGVKSDVEIQNTGDIPAYIRARIVVTWKDAKGNVSSTVPVKNTDYTITFNETDWTQQGGYWYCKTAVPVDEKTPALITECKKRPIQTPLRTMTFPSKFWLTRFRANPPMQLKKLGKLP